MKNKEPIKKNDKKEQPSSTPEKDQVNAAKNTQLDIGQDIRQNSGNNDSTNAMVTGEKNSYR